MRRDADPPLPQADDDLLIVQFSMHSRRILFRGGAESQNRRTVGGFGGGVKLKAS